MSPSCRALLILVAAALLGCPSEEPEPDGPTLHPGPWAVSGLAVTDVVLSQAVDIPLRVAGEDVAELNAPVVASRPAVLRVGVDPDYLWVARDVRASLLLLRPDGSEERRDVIFEIEEASDMTDAETTANFDLDATDVTPGLRVAVSFWELEGPGDDESPSGWPDEGSRALEVTDFGSVLRVELVPVRYDNDGSGRMPDTSPEQIALLEDYLLKIYPVREVYLTVGDVWPTDIYFDRDGAGMGDLLSRMRDLRTERDVPWDTYLYALIEPRDTQQQFCSLGCTAGLSYRVTNPNNSSLRVSVSLGYTGDSTAWFMVHELGHAHDRGHAPCGGAAGVDEEFPYSDGGLGVPGWDLVEGEAVETEETFDFMSYCHPQWISDYTYSALHQRTAAIDGLRDLQEARAAQDWTAVTLLADGGARAKREVVAFDPEGERVPVRLLDARGAVVGVVDGWFVAFTHTDGGTLMLPTPAADIASVQLPGRDPLTL